MRGITIIGIVLMLLYFNTPEIQPGVKKDVEKVEAEITLHTERTVKLIYDYYPRIVQSSTYINGELQEVSALAPSEQIVDTSDDFSLTHGNSLTAEQWDKIVAEYNPAIQNTGVHAVKEGERTQIDNAYVLAMWIKESTVGLYGAARDTKSPGNIICAGYPTCIGRFRSYPSWEVGITQHFDLLRCYRDSSLDCSGLWNGKTHTTLEDAIDTWAPPIENDTNGYKLFVTSLVREWRNANQVNESVTIQQEESFIPIGSPIRDSYTISQGYAVGSHAPAEIWGGIDLAVSEGTPIYATHSGIAIVRPNTWPCGNCLTISNEQYKTLFGHLARFNVTDNQIVERGDIIGYVGSTGQATGPHLHYEVWDNGINKNPEDYME